MSIVAQRTDNRNVALAMSSATMQQLNEAMAERAALAQSLPDNPSESECAAFAHVDAQVQAQMEAWMLTLAASSELA